MPVVSVANHKGGCGKTTTAVNLAAALSANRKTVLLIDMDPQGHASLAFGVNPEGLATMFDVLDPAVDKPLRDVVLKLSATLHLAPSDIMLNAMEQKLSGRNGREHRLRDKLDETAGHYDYLVVDCPPSLGLLTINALLCSDQVVVPVEASVFSLHGFEKLRETCAMLKNGLGHQPQVFGLATMIDARTRFARSFQERLGETCGEYVLETTIPGTIKFREAAAQGLSILDYAPFSKGAESCLRLADEILRINTRRGRFAAKVPAEARDTVRRIRFSFPDDQGVRVVRLAGEFNNWDPAASALSRSADGEWVTEYPLRSGSYQYKYIVDGEWVLDPRNSARIETAGGSVNSVVTVE